MPRTCAACCRKYTRKQGFTPTQWGKGEGHSRCRSCVAANAPICAPDRSSGSGGGGGCSSGGGDGGGGGATYDLPVPSSRLDFLAGHRGLALGLIAEYLGSVQIVIDPAEYLDLADDQIVEFNDFGLES